MPRSYTFNQAYQLPHRTHAGTVVPSGYTSSAKVLSGSSRNQKAPKPRNIQPQKAKGRTERKRRFEYEMLPHEDIVHLIGMNGFNMDEVFEIIQSHNLSKDPSWTIEKIKEVCKTSLIIPTIFKLP